MSATYQPFVEAHYTPSNNPAYAGNPFIEHLGDLPDDKTLAKRLTRLPAFNSEQHNLPANHRIDLLSDLHGICVPLPRLVKLARAILKLMREGYRTRRPYSLEDNAKVSALFGAQKEGFTKGFMATPRRVDLARQMSMALVGASGCGKSFGLSQISGLVDEVVYHEKFGKWQLPFVFIEMSYDGESVHTLASELFRELDRLLPDAGYIDLYMNRKGLNAEQRLSKALALCYEHGVGALVVDETQNQRGIGNDRDGNALSTGKRSKVVKSETPLMKLLVTASNTSHIPLIMSGTLEMQSIVGARFTRLRRMSGNGSVQWLPLERSKDLTAPGEFEMMLMALWRYQYLLTPVRLTDIWAEHFWDVTQGIPDIMVKLWASVQETAIASRLETLTHPLVDAVFQSEFAMVAMSLKALRENNLTVLSALTDLYSVDSEAEPTFTKSTSPKKTYPSPTATTVVAPPGSTSDMRTGPRGTAPPPEVSRWKEDALV
ncbi:ATP-binding protein [Rhodoferax sp. U11-2br]|uniref:ATP-binding protein n=1 Tax=Rhodoferax sp. U11-2br TaxID=2838878 RepID=UPI001BE8A097|nr:ATP-binding protein [Rhodoferax sp. U11-2br]MBT3067961.1 ATP-binding protein [Rhodoferax sp. U11-2br]